ncbi:potassium voltage-gated channel subfamily E member 3 isoform X2 [Sceloporus undulatus]|uniref:potassium voltage-gated channel subfamily E member 3 isoform X2 n=1 Tax=Sceloporus undulatus TaxID=8520 RepID=UPI001C4CF824|nr:potassium voltage-gated channel subfamily E member 3 isoform X2 [Sceloporus undulatus]
MITGSDAVSWRPSKVMMMGNMSETWLHKLDWMLRALNQTLYHSDMCPQSAKPETEEDEEEKETYAYMYILFVMILFAVTVGSLILGYTRSRKEFDKQSDPYHVYIKNRVTMI